jgi:hypothetical protein
MLKNANKMFKIQIDPAIASLYRAAAATGQLDTGAREHDC